MEESTFTRKLLSLTEERGVSLSAQQASWCYRHIQLMLEWNGTTNLTRIVDWDEILVKHLLDSLFPSRWLPTSGRFLDIGTGPGFPGIPLKIFHPEIDLVLLESHRKKASFLRVLAAQLPLSGISILQARFEEAPRILSEAPGFDAAVMRAVPMREDYLAIASRIVLRPGGVFAWWAGPAAPSGEAFSSPTAVPSMVMEGDFPYLLPGTTRPRRLLVWRRKS